MCLPGASFVWMRCVVKVELVDIPVHVPVVCIHCALVLIVMQRVENKTNCRRCLRKPEKVFQRSNSRPASSNVGV